MSDHYLAGKTKAMILDQIKVNRIYLAIFIPSALAVSYWLYSIDFDGVSQGVLSAIAFALGGYFSEVRELKSQLSWLEERGRGVL